MNYISYIVGGCHLLLESPNGISNKSTDWSLTLNTLGQFFFLILVFIAILLMAVYSLKFAARLKNYSGAGSNVRVIESKSLGTQNYVHLVKAGNKYILIGSSKEHVSFLTEIDSECVTDIFSSEKGSEFQGRLTSQMKKFFYKEAPPEE